MILSIPSMFPLFRAASAPASSASEASMADSGKQRRALENPEGFEARASFAASRVAAGDFAKSVLFDDCFSAGDGRCVLAAMRKHCLIRPGIETCWAMRRFFADGAWAVFGDLDDADLIAELAELGSRGLRDAARAEREGGRLGLELWMAALASDPRAKRGFAGAKL